MTSSNGPLAARSDVALADLPLFLDNITAVDSFETSTLVLAIDPESTTLPCCGAILGPNNQSVLGLCSRSHWLKLPQCKEYWSDIHLVCVRKYTKPKNSVLATSTEVRKALEAYFDGDVVALYMSRTIRSLQRLTSNINMPTERHVLAPRSSSVTMANRPATTTLRRVNSSASLLSKPSRKDADTPSLSAQRPFPSNAVSQASNSRPPVSATGSLSARGTLANVRSPIVTRRRSGALAKYAASMEPTVSPADPPSLPRAATKSSHAVAPRSSFAPSVILMSGASRRASNIPMPTPVRKVLMQELAKVSPDSPGSPLDLRSNLSKRVSATVNSDAVIAPARSISTQTEDANLDGERLQVLLSTFAGLEKEYARAQMEISGLRALVSDLELESKRLKAQKTALLAEVDQHATELKASRARTNDLEIENILLERRVQCLTKTNAETAAETAKLKNDFVLQADHFKKGEVEASRLRQELQTQIERIRGEQADQLLQHDAAIIGLQEQLKEAMRQTEIAQAPSMTSVSISPIRVDSVVVPSVEAGSSFAPQSADCSGRQIEISRAVEAFACITPKRKVSLDPQTTPTPKSVQAKTDALASVARAGGATPVSAARAAIGSRTPLTKSAKKSKHGILYWKRIAKRRLFA